jgi:PEP-CTERM motif
MSCKTVCRAAVLLLAVWVVGVSGANAQPGLIPNANVETDSEPDGTPDSWFHSGGTSYVDDNGPSAPGSKAIQLDSAGQDWRSSEAPAVSGATYNWSFDYKFLEGATGEFRADLRFFDSPNFAGEDTPLIGVSNIGQWQTLTRTKVAPPRTANPLDGPFVLDTRFSSNLFAPGNGLVRIDNVIVTLVPEPTTLALLALAGSSALAGVARRRRS